MNERIKELLDQATIDALFETQNAVDLLDNPVTKQQRQLQLEKFAELIVKECINEIAYIGKANEVFGDRTDKGGLNHILWTTETAIEKIKEHFGVEE